MTNKVNLINDYLWVGNCYVVDREWESTLYCGTVSELNISTLINEGVLDPSNELSLYSKGKRWEPHYCAATNSWSYTSSPSDVIE